MKTFQNNFISISNILGYNSIYFGDCILSQEIPYISFFAKFFYRLIKQATTKNNKKKLTLRIFIDIRLFLILLVINASPVKFR